MTTFGVASNAGSNSLLAAYLLDGFAGHSYLSSLPTNSFNTNAANSATNTAGLVDVAALQSDMLRTAVGDPPVPFSSTGGGTSEDDQFLAQLQALLQDAPPAGDNAAAGAFSGAIAAGAFGGAIAASAPIPASSNATPPANDAAADNSPHFRHTMSPAGRAGLQQTSSLNDRAISSLLSRQRSSLNPAARPASAPGSPVRSGFHTGGTAAGLPSSRLRSQADGRQRECSDELSHHDEDHKHRSIKSLKVSVQSCPGSPVRPRGNARASLSPSSTIEGDTDVAEANAAQHFERAQGRGGNPRVAHAQTMGALSGDSNDQQGEDSNPNTASDVFKRNVSEAAGRGTSSGAGQIKPKSQTEKYRRERISEGMNRLRAAVDAHGDVASMLNFAVDYIQNMQKANRSLRLELLRRQLSCSCNALQQLPTSLLTHLDALQHK